MNLKHTSIFNLIEIFRAKRESIKVKEISPKTHCEQKQIHDFYCKSEKLRLKSEHIL